MYIYTVGICHLSVLVCELMGLNCACFCVCVCAANTHPLSGSSFADGVPDVIGVLLPELSRGVQAW